MKKTSLKKLAWMSVFFMLFASIAQAENNQVVYAGEGKRVEHGASYVEYSKIAEQAYDIQRQPIENQFDITLNVSTMEDVLETEIELDAAVTLVLDVSGSMLWNINGDGWCRNCKAWKGNHSCNYYLRTGWPVDVDGDGEFDYDYDFNGDGVIDSKDEDLLSILKQDLKVRLHSLRLIKAMARRSAIFRLLSLDKLPVRPRS